MMGLKLRNMLEVAAFEALEAGDPQWAQLLADATCAEKRELFEHSVANRRELELGVRSLESGQNR